jgi:hypothetical protein
MRARQDHLPPHEARARTGSASSQVGGIWVRDAALGRRLIARKRHCRHPKMPC